MENKEVYFLDSPTDKLKLPDIPQFNNNDEFFGNALGFSYFIN